MTDFKHDPDPFEAQLRSLVPAPPRLDRAAVFAAAAGAEPELEPAAAPRVWPWRLAAAAGWATAAAVGFAWANAEPRVLVEERVVVKTVERPAVPAPPVAAPGSEIAGSEIESPNTEPAPSSGPGRRDETARLMAWLDSPAGGPLTAASLRDLPVGWPPPPAPWVEPAPGDFAPPPPADLPSVRELSKRWRDGLL